MSIICSIVFCVIVSDRLLRVFIAGGNDGGTAGLLVRVCIGGVDAGCSVRRSGSFVDIVGTLGSAAVSLTLGGGAFG